MKSSTVTTMRLLRHIDVQSIWIQPSG